MKTFKITEEIREKAYKIAVERNLVSGDRGGTYPGMSNTVDMHWKGVIAELVLMREYEGLVPAQDMVKFNSDTLAADLMYGGIGLEVKCRRAKGMIKSYLINVRLHMKKFHLYDLYICCGINGLPRTATEMYVYGLIESARVSGYRVLRDITDPAYEIPMRSIIPFEEKSERVADLLERVFGIESPKPADARGWFR